MKKQNEERPQDQEQPRQDGGSRSAQDEEIRHAGSDSDANTQHGVSDMNTRPSEGAAGSRHSSGITTKRNVTGSDFDGQVSPS